MVNLRTLEYLVALAEHKHFGKAAQACHVSQPTLSMQIKKMEQWLDLQLLERTNKSVQLTSIGSQIAERARSITRDVNELKLYAKLAQNPLAGDCRIGIIHTIAPYLLPKWMPKLHKTLPDLHCYLLEGQTDPLTLKLLQGDCDVIIAALPIDHPQINSAALFEEPFYLAVAKEHPLANRSAVNLADINEDEILLLQEGHCLRDQALAVCQRAQLQIHEQFQATSLETLRHMVASGLGVTLVPQMAVTQDKAKQCVYLPFATAVPSRTVALFWRKTNARVEMIDELLKSLRACKV